MKCQKCGAEIPEGKIYCEKCGQAIQMVPDYNPVDDISIGTEESVDEQLRSHFSEQVLENGRRGRNTGRTKTVVSKMEFSNRSSFVC